MSEYLGRHVYVEDEKTGTRIYENGDGNKRIISLTPEMAQKLFEILAKTRLILRLDYDNDEDFV